MSEAVTPIHAIKGRGTATRMAHRNELDASQFRSALLSGQADLF